MICASCGKENQDHFKFCLGCGAELRSAAAEAKIEALLAEARDFERFDMLDQATAKLELVVSLRPLPEHKRALEAMRARMKR